MRIQQAALAALSAFVVLAFSGANIALAVEVNDTCKENVGNKDIDVLSAS